MILRDIHFDLCYVKNDNCIHDLVYKEKYSLEDAIRTDYENNWKRKRYKFRSETQCITEVIIRLLYRNGKFHFNDCGKIIIECKTNKDNEPEKIYNCNGIYTISTYFEYDRYVGLDDFQKKIYISFVAKECLLRICEYISFPKNQILEVFSVIKENNFLNEYNVLKNPQEKNI